MNTKSMLVDNRSRQAKFGMSLVKILITVALAILMGVLSSPSMYTKDASPIYRLPIFAGMVALILLLSAGRIGKFSTKKLAMLFLWAGFSATSLISGMINDEDVVALLWLSLGVPYLLFCIFPQAAGRNGNVMVLVATVLAFLPYMAASLIFHPVSIPYHGVFSNPNSLGIIMATLSAGLLALLRGAISSNGLKVVKYIWIGILSLTLGTAFVLIILSNSRTSLITFVILSMIFVWSLFFNKYRNRWWIALVSILVIVTAVVVLGSAMSNGQRGDEIKSIFIKMENKAERGDITGGRVMIWQRVLNDFDFLGHGHNAFPFTYGYLSHNTYIQALGGSGPVVLAFLIAIHVMAIFLGFKRIVRHIAQDGYALGPLLIVMNYIILGLAETIYGILGNGIQFSFLLMIGVLVNDNPIEDLSTRNVDYPGIQTAPAFAKGEK